jgi:hypothetical protein
MGALYDSAGRDARLDSTGEIFGFVPFSMRASSESVVLDMPGTMDVEGRNFGGFALRNPERSSRLPIDTGDFSHHMDFRVDKKSKLRTIFSFIIASEDMRFHDNSFLTQISIFLALLRQKEC